MTEKIQGSSGLGSLACGNGNFASIQGFGRWFGA